MKVFLLLGLVTACQAAFAPPQRIAGSPIAKKKFVYTVRYKSMALTV
jgi:hypothetical protein